MTNYLLLGLAVLLNVAAQIALKMTTRGAGELSLGSIAAEPVRFLFSPWFMLGCALYAASVINWLVVLSRVELSVAYPLMSTAYILTFAAGLAWFGESVSATRVAGLLVIIAGVVLITRPVAPHG